MSDADELDQEIAEAHLVAIADQLDQIRELTAELQERLGRFLRAASDSLSDIPPN